MIKGFADEMGTLDYFAEHVDIPWRDASWFKVSPIAIGTHLGEMTESDSLLYRESIKYALTNGINFIDTAINYRGMKSERDIGHVLQQLIVEEEMLKREQIIISSKAGILPGDMDAKLVPVQYLQEILYKNNILSPSDVNIVDHQKHVLSPSYYEFAIRESRKHLGLETIDIYYLHNPELSMQVLGPEVFYEKLIPLFSFFEEQVHKGKIKHYGIATWSAFLEEPEHPGYISLEKIVDIAHLVAGKDHHFSFIQVPYNPNQSAAAHKLNQPAKGVQYSLINAANQLDVFVTTSAPFNLGKLFKGERKAESILQNTLKTDGLLSTMVGMKQLRNVQENLRTVKKLY